jgi:acetate kinase
MKILVFNCGSSSIKYQLIDMEKKEAISKGLLERIGLPSSRLIHKKGGEKFVIENDIEDHQHGAKIILGALTDEKIGVISNIKEIDGVGHRVVHGGEIYAESVIIDEHVEKVIEDCFELAPLHNPANLMGVKSCKKLLPHVSHVAVFDTAFHQTMFPYAYLYPLPYDFYVKYKIRRYGFHGTSHRYVARRAADMLNKPLAELKLITCHLGNGASITAIENGKSVDTSMGFTPLAGLMMGTRCGDIDPALPMYIMGKEGLTAKEVDTLLNKRSGVLGISGMSSDMRDIEDKAFKEKDERCKLTLDMYHYRIIKYIGAYVAAMNGVDAIIFTGGVGENSPESREEICKNLGYLNTSYNKELNNVKGKERVISTSDSKVKLLIVPTNEELAIATETENLIKEV